MKPNEIRSIYETGMSIQDISKRFGVKRYWIKKALVGYTRTVANTNSMKARLAARDLSVAEKQCILGTLLGDGCLKSSPNGRSHHLSVTHGYKQKPYIEFKQSILIGSHLRPETNSGYAPGTIQWNLTFWNAKFMDLIYQVSHRNGVKVITNDWLSMIDLEGIAYWFMDDGSSSYANNPGQSVNVSLSTMCFSYEENILLVNKLNWYEADARVVKDSRGTGWRISFSVQGGQKILHLIDPYVRRIPSMIYKLKTCEPKFSVKTKVGT